MPYRRSKYHAKKAEYRGETFDSRAEAAYAKYLDFHDETGCLGHPVLMVIRQPKFTLGCPENVYKPDFLVVTPRFVIAEDVKGSETPKFKKDRRLWAKYGTCPLRVIRLKLRYPKVEDEDNPPLPEIKGIDFDVIPGGCDKRSYSPLCPEWLREPCSKA